RDLNYEVELYSNGTQSDSHVMLLVNAGTFVSGQEKSTTFHWADAEGDYLTKWALNVGNNGPLGAVIDGDFVLVVQDSPMSWYKYWHNNGTFITSYSTATPPANLGIATDGTFVWINRGASVDDAVAWWKNNGTSAPSMTISMNEDGAANAGDLTYWDGLLMTVNDADNKVYAWWTSNKSLAWSWTLNLTVTGIQTGITTDGTYFWITNYASDDVVHKYWWDGTYIGPSFDTTSDGATEIWGIGIGDEKFWMPDFTDDEMYVYTAIAGLSITLNVPVDNANSSSLSNTFSALVEGVLDEVQLYGDFDGTWKINSTNSSGINDAQYNFTLGLTEGVYTWAYWANDTASNSVFSSNRTLTVDTTAPTMTLLGPNDGLNSTNTSQVFAVNVYDEINVDTVILYGDFSGSWAINTTNSSGLNNTDYNVTLGLTDGTYTWAYWSNDTTGNSGFTSNRTVMIDTTVPYIAFNAATEANASIKRRDWVYANVTVTETNEHAIVFAIFNGSGVVNSTQFTSGSVRVINWTGLADAFYEYNVTVNDTVGNSNTTETRTIYLTTFSLFLENIESNISAELNSSISLVANSTATELTICIDIDHPDYGINYTCETLSDYNISIDYFRNTTFSDLTTSKDFYFVNHLNYNLTHVSHQYDEVESLTFNISGTNDPTNTVFFRANTTPDITNQTQYEPLIDRYYDGKLVGSNVYDFELSDGSSSSNVTFQNEGEQLVYLLIDDILQNMVDYSFFLNVTGFLFGFSVDYGNHPGIEGHSVGDGIGFLDYDFVDTALTTAQIDRSGAIMAGNVSSVNHFFDDFEDG
ncbi:hypothetical protein LCGC14_1906020, partial [marine sediment metagenome]